MDWCKTSWYIPAGSTIWYLGEGLVSLPWCVLNAWIATTMGLDILVNFQLWQGIFYESPDKVIQTIPLLFWISYNRSSRKCGSCIFAWVWNTLLNTPDLVYGLGKPKVPVSDEGDTRPSILVPDCFRPWQTQCDERCSNSDDNFAIICRYISWSTVVFVKWACQQNRSWNLQPCPLQNISWHVCGRKIY